MSERTTAARQHFTTRRNANHRFDAIAAPRRRGVLRELAGCDGAADLTALAERLEVRLREAGEGTEDNHRIAVALRHVDLPKLDELGYVQYDDEARLVSITDDGVAVSEFLGRESTDR